jgi:deazaflavin-dependent oxidoreductase (nitroreductase family)
MGLTGSNGSNGSNGNNSSNGKNGHASYARRAFPAPGTMLHDLIADPEFRETFHSKLKLTNRLVVPLYKLRVLPLLGAGKAIMLLTTKGRKSHTMRDFPVGYQRIDGTIYVFSGWGKETNWYKNLMAYPEDVYVQTGFHRFHVCPEVVEDRRELKGIIERFILRNPTAAHTLIGWDPERDDLHMADLSPMIEKVLIVRFREQQS